jgi:hypothetical protein
MINAITGETHVIQLRPTAGLTVTDVEAELADRRAEAKQIDPATCEIFGYYTEALDPYGLFDIPAAWSCVGKEILVRYLPDGFWVWEGDLPEEIHEALRARISREKATP